NHEDTKTRRQPRISCSKPEDYLPREKTRGLHAAAVARIELRRELHQQISLDGVAAARLDARHRRVPRREAPAPHNLAEAKMIDPSRRVQARADLVAAFERRCHRPERAAD